MRSAQGVIGWIAIAAVLLSALPLGANRPVAWLTLALVGALLLLTQIGLDAMRSPDSERLRAIAAPTALWLAALGWAAFQTIEQAGGWAHPSWALLADDAGLRSISADPAAGVLLLPRLAAYAAFFWVVARAAKDRTRALRMVQATALSASALAVYGLVAAGTGVNPILETDGGRTVVSASFVNRNSFATWVAFGALANLAVFVAQGSGEAASNARRGLRDALETFFAGGWLFALGFAVTVTALIATQSRAGALSGLVGLAVFFAAYRRREAGGGAALALTIALLLFAAAVAGSGLATRLFGASGEEARFAVYPLIVEAIAARPWLGHGLGAFQDVFRAHVTPELATGEWDLAHNSYLENLLELGVPAALALYASIGLLVWRVRRGARERRRDRAWPCLALACAATAGVHSLFDFSLQMPAVAALFAGLLAIGWTQSFRAPGGQSTERKARPASSRTAVSRPE